MLTGETSESSGAVFEEKVRVKAGVTPADTVDTEGGLKGTLLKSHLIRDLMLRRVMILVSFSRFGKGITTMRVCDPRYWKHTVMNGYGVTVPVQMD